MDENQNILFKGEVAREIDNADKILMTELLFSGLLRKLSLEETLALFSVLSPQVRVAKAEMVENEISPAFSEVLFYVQQKCEELITVEKESNVGNEESDPTKRLNLAFYEIIYKWACKMKFSEVVQLNNIDEGMIIRMVLNVE